MSDESVDRRRFLLAVAATAAAATATGAGAALLNREKVVTPPTAPLPRVVTNTQAAIDSAGEMSNLAAELISAQADNVRLQAELDAALRRISAIETANGSSGSTITNLQTELANAGSQIGILSGLVALYEQLDDVNLSAVLSGSLITLHGAFDELTDDLPTLEEGLALGQQALQNLENELPLLAQAQGWLETQMSRIDGFYGIVLASLANAVDEAGDFLQLLGRWFTDVLDWLPFGMGDKASAIMTAMTDMLDETTITVKGFNVHAGASLDKWLKPNQTGGPAPMQTNLIQPLRNSALAPAGTLATKAASSKATFKSEVSGPAIQALTNHDLLKERIVLYRSTHKIGRQDDA